MILVGMKRDAAADSSLAFRGKKERLIKLMKHASFFFSNYETDSGNRFSAPVNVSTPVSAPTAAPRALHTNKINQAYTYQRRHWITEAVKRHAGIIAMSLFPSSKLHKRP